MTRRRVLELLVAAGVFFLLLAIVFVRPTARKTGTPPVRALFTRAPGGAPDFSSGSYRSAIAYAPDSSRALVLYPVEFEERADVYVMSHGLADGYRLVLDDSLHGGESPKACGWIDRARAWVVVGHTMGTVSPGGDLYELSPDDGAGKLLWASPDSGRTQALSLMPPSQLRVRVFDSAMNLYRDSTITLAVVPGQ
jgi:hypothetical protein